MSTKTLVFLGMSVGSIIGGYVPSLFGAGIFSMWSIITSAIGAIVGILIVHRISTY